MEAGGASRPSWRQMDDAAVEQKAREAVEKDAMYAELAALVGGADVLDSAALDGAGDDGSATADKQLASIPLEHGLAEETGGGGSQGWEDDEVLLPSRMSTGTSAEPPATAQRKVVAAGPSPSKLEAERVFSARANRQRGAVDEAKRRREQKKAKRLAARKGLLAAVAAPASEFAADTEPQLPGSAAEPAAEPAAATAVSVALPGAAAQLQATLEAEAPGKGPAQSDPAPAAASSTADWLEGLSSAVDNLEIETEISGHSATSLAAKSTQSQVILPLEPDPESEDAPDASELGHPTRSSVLAGALPGRGRAGPVPHPYGTPSQTSLRLASTLSSSSSSSSSSAAAATATAAATAAAAAARAAAEATASSAPCALTVPTKEERTKLFERMDYNGNGTLSLAEIDKCVLELFPHFNNKPALMRAYKAADVSGDGWVGRREFRLLLEYLVYFNDLWGKFNEIDASGDKRIDLTEFKLGCGTIGIDMTETEMEAEFALIDANGGGLVLFDEFCAWAARRSVSIGDDDDRESQSTAASANADSKDADDVGVVTQQQSQPSDSSFSSKCSAGMDRSMQVVDSTQILELQDEVKALQALVARRTQDYEELSAQNRDLQRLIQQRSVEEDTMEQVERVATELQSHLQRLEEENTSLRDELELRSLQDSSEGPLTKGCRVRVVDSSSPLHGLVGVVQGGPRLKDRIVSVQFQSSRGDHSEPDIEQDSSGVVVRVEEIAAESLVMVDSYCEDGEQDIKAASMCKALQLWITDFARDAGMADAIVESSPLIEAAKSRDIATCQACLQQRALGKYDGVGGKGWNVALRLAVQTGDAKLVRSLLPKPRQVLADSSNASAAPRRRRRSSVSSVRSDGSRTSKVFDVSEYTKKRQARIAAQEQKRKEEFEEQLAALPAGKKKIDPERARQQAERLSVWKVRKIEATPVKEKHRFDVYGSPSASGAGVSASTPSSSPAKYLEAASAAKLLEQLGNIAASGLPLDLDSKLFEDVATKLRQSTALSLELQRYKRHAKPLEQQTATASREAAKLEKQCREQEEVIKRLTDEAKIARDSARHYQVQLKEALRSKERFFHEFSDAASMDTARSERDAAEDQALIADLKRKLKNREELDRTARLVSTDAVTELNVLRQSMKYVQDDLKKAKKTADAERRKHKDACEKHVDQIRRMQKMETRLGESKEELADKDSRIQRLSRTVEHMREQVREAVGQPSGRPAFMRGKKGTDADVQRLREELEVVSTDRARLSADLRKARTTIGLRQKEIKKREAAVTQREAQLEEMVADLAAARQRHTASAVGEGGSPTNRIVPQRPKTPPSAEEKQQQELRVSWADRRSRSPSPRNSTKADRAWAIHTQQDSHDNSSPSSSSWRSDARGTPLEEDDSPREFSPSDRSSSARRDHLARLEQMWDGTSVMKHSVASQRSKSRRLQLIGNEAIRIGKAPSSSASADRQRASYSSAVTVQLRDVASVKFGPGSLSPNFAARAALLHIHDWHCFSIKLVSGESLDLSTTCDGDTEAWCVGLRSLLSSSAMERGGGVGGEETAWLRCASQFRWQRGCMRAQEARRLEERPAVAQIFAATTVAMHSSQAAAEEDHTSEADLSFVDRAALLIGDMG
jgi:Ca2+-binding EF-hand superfamily protein